MANSQGDGAKAWEWLRQVQSTTQQLGQMCSEGVGEAKRRLGENRPGIDQFVRNIGDNVQQGVKKVQETQPGLDQLVRNIGDNVQKGVKNIQENLARDPWSSPPTASEMAGLDLVYVNRNLIAMGFPMDNRPRPPPLPSDGAAAAAGEGGGTRLSRGGSRLSGGSGVPVVQQGNDIDLVAAVLRSRHSGHYMVWNVSEEGYNYSLFEDQVLEYRFPGHPAPPLGMLFKICTALESWLGADAKNVAAVHCLTGRGRTSTVLACYLAWIGEFPTPSEALLHVAMCKNIPMERLTIPSQRRYLSYFASVMEGVRPRSEPLLLRRVIMNTIPTFGKKGGDAERASSGAGATKAGDAGEGGADQDALGCCPYIQIFKGGALLFTATYQPTEGRAKAVTQAEEEEKLVSEGSKGADAETATPSLAWAYTSDDSISFPVDCVLQGDLLLRCRHLGSNGRRVSMFRAAFHTGYVPSGVLRLTKLQLDGACADDRFNPEFFLDLIFAPVENSPAPTSENADGAEAGKDVRETAATESATESATAPSQGDAAAGLKAQDSGSEAPATREGGLVIDAEAGEAFDSMLHRDARFWEEIAARKERRSTLLKERAEAKAREKAQGSSGVPDSKAGGATLRNRVAAAARGVGIRFSIDEEEAAQSARVDEAPVPAAGSASERTSGINDDDLLAQLAQAEMEQDALLGSAGSGEDHAMNIHGFAPATDGSVPRPPRPSGSSDVKTKAQYTGGARDGDAAVLEGAGAGDAAAKGEGADEETKRGAGMARSSVDAEEMIVFDLPTKAPTAGDEGSKVGDGSGEAAGGEQQAKQACSQVKPDAAESPASVAEGSRGAVTVGKPTGAPRPGTGAGGAPAATVAASGSLEDELNQLEQLERELGIMGVGGEGARKQVPKSEAVEAKPAAGAAEVSKDDAFDLDNLDELEGYLESLAK